MNTDNIAMNRVILGEELRRVIFRGFRYSYGNRSMLGNSTVTQKVQADYLQYIKSSDLRETKRSGYGSE